MNWICSCQHSNPDDCDVCTNCGLQRPISDAPTAMDIAAPQPMSQSSMTGQVDTDQNVEGWEALGTSIYVRMEKFGNDFKLLRPKYLLSKLTPKKVKVVREATPFPQSFLDEPVPINIVQENHVLAENPAGLHCLDTISSIVPSTDEPLQLWNDELYKVETAPQESGGAGASSSAAPLNIACGGASMAAAVTQPGLATPDDQNMGDDKPLEDQKMPPAPTKKRTFEVMDGGGAGDGEDVGIPATKKQKEPTLQNIEEELEAEAVDEGADVDDKALGNGGEQIRLVQLMREFDRGHIVALALGGIDHSAQIVPQVRSCNRGTWLAMEADLVRLAWSVHDEQKKWLTKIAARRLSAPTNTDVGLKIPNKMDSGGNVAAKIFIFYHEASPANTQRRQWSLLERIPAWFYVQVYFITHQGYKLGLAHYSIGNGKSEKFIPPTPEEIGLFERAHQALNYPADALAKVVDGTWYPDPPYAALQWLADHNYLPVPLNGYSQEGFNKRQIPIIRKYNWWINGGHRSTKASMMSDHRPSVRELRRTLADLDVRAHTKLVMKEKLLSDETQHVEHIIAIEKKKLADIETRKCLPSKCFNKADLKAFGNSVGALKLPIADDSPILQSTPALVELVAAIRVRKDKLTTEAPKKNKAEVDWLEKWAQLFDKQQKFLDARDTAKQRLDSYAALKVKGGDASARSVVEGIGEEKKALLDEITGEEPDLYETLDTSGGRSFPEVDHIVPKGRGGKNRYDNARLISFAQNHIYRDKVYLAMSRPACERQDAYARCKKNYEKEEKQLEAGQILSKHLELVDEFRQHPPRELLERIRDFIATWDVKLDHRSDRPAPPTDQPVPMEQVAPK